MANKLAKTRPVDEPYAIFEGNGIKWHILKTYKTPASEKKDRSLGGSPPLKAPCPMMSSSMAMHIHARYQDEWPPCLGLGSLDRAIRSFSMV
jgi:hypothetical protein